MFGFFKKAGQKIKEKAMQAMLEKQLGNLPEGQKQALMKAIEANPQFFEKLAAEMQEATKNGGNQMYAMMQVMGRHKAELQKIMSQTQ